MPAHPSVQFWRKDLSNISEHADIGAQSVVHAGVHIHDKVKIGKRCKLEAGVLLFNGVTIEDEVFIGPDVVFTNDRKLAVDVFDRTKFKPMPTLVKNRAKIGANATIICGITIGEGAIIGAGAVVTKDVPAGETWVGNPAKKIIRPVTLKAVKGGIKISERPRKDIDHWYE